MLECHSLQEQSHSKILLCSLLVFESWSRDQGECANIFNKKKSRSSWKRSKHVTFTLVWRFSYCQQVTTVLRWRMFWLESDREEIWSKRCKKCKLFWKEERVLIMNHKEKKFNLFVWTFCYDIQGKMRPQQGTQQIFRSVFAEETLWMKFLIASNQFLQIDFCFHYI